MSLLISTWLWGDAFSPEDAAKLHAGLSRNLKCPFRFLVITDQCEGSATVQHGEYGPIEVHEIPNDALYLTKVKGCFARLKMFDEEWQRSIGMVPDDVLVNVDLDTVVTGEMDEPLNREEPFVILQGGNASNPCPYNGALIMLEQGAHGEVWRDFTLERASAAPFYEFPDDQGWIWHKVPNAPGWKCGPEHGLYVFRKPGWPRLNRATPDDRLPQGARLVTFMGKNKPAGFTTLKWVREHWR